MTSVKWAARWHSKPHSKDDKYKSVPSPPPFLPPAKTPYLTLTPASHHTPYESDWSRSRERQGLTSTWLCLPIFFFLSLSPAVCTFFLSPLLHLYVYPGQMINPPAIFKSTSGAETAEVTLRSHQLIYTAGHHMSIHACPTLSTALPPTHKLFLSVSFSIVELRCFITICWKQCCWYSMEERQRNNSSEGIVHTIIGFKTFLGNLKANF